MNGSPQTGLWAVLPSSLRTAFVGALVVTLTSAGLLFRAESASELPSELSAPRDLAGPKVDPDDLKVTPTSTPTPRAGRARSEAVISVPREDGPEAETRESGLPTFGTYVFMVQGTEAGPALSARSFPSEMRMTVHRDETLGDPGTPALRANELIFDLSFSADHEEREIVAYETDGVAITYESRSVTFNASTSSEEVTYDPDLLQIPTLLDDDTSESGTSRAISTDGSQVRVEDWTVKVDGREEIGVLGEEVDAWVVTVDRSSRTGAAEPSTKTRRYWFDPARGIWVKWEETISRGESSGLASSTYTAQYTATLSRIEPL